MTNIRRQQRTTEFDNALVEADTVIHRPDGTVEMKGFRFSMQGRSHFVEETASDVGPAQITQQPTSLQLPRPDAEPVVSWREHMAADIAAVRSQRSLPDREFPALPPGA